LPEVIKSIIIAICVFLGRPGSASWPFLMGAPDGHAMGVADPA
jgi:hypothetical protein